MTRAVWAIGDVQGCYRSLRALVGRLRGWDELWLAGDLVNRGPRSLETLRWVRSLGGAAVTVLGNHDLHLLARVLAGTPPKKRDTLDDVLEAPDRDELVDWLRRRPLLHPADGHVMVHAGLLPRWTLGEARRAARAAEAALRGPHATQVLRAAIRERPRWDGSAGATLAVMTRMRVCTPRGGLRLKFDGTVTDVAAGEGPWFVHPHPRRPRVICGHWSALGLHVSSDVVALDSGCVWGGKLTAMRLSDGKIVQQENVD